MKKFTLALLVFLSLNAFAQNSGTKLKQTTVGAQGNVNQNNQNANTTIQYTPPQNQNGNGFTNKLTNDTKNRSYGIGIIAKDYRIKIPASNGVISESIMQVGATYTVSQIQNFATITGSFGSSSGGMSYCSPVYRSSSLNLSGGLSVLKGYKVGNAVFAYVMGGGQANGSFISTTTEFKKDQQTAYVYLGMVGEAGMGLQGKAGTVMAGGIATAGLSKAQQVKNENQTTENYPNMQPYQNNSSLATIGGKVRAVNSLGRIEATVSQGQGQVDQATTNPVSEPNIPANPQNLSSRKIDVFQVGCEVAINVTQNLTVGAKANYTNSKSTSHKTQYGFGVENTTTTLENSNVSIQGTAGYRFGGGKKQKQVPSQ